MKSFRKIGSLGVRQWNMELNYSRAAVIGLSSASAGVYFAQHFHTSRTFLAEEQLKLVTPETLEEDDRYNVPENVLNLIKDRVHGIKDLDICLYQYQVCPFCSKVRAFLDYYNIPYTFVEVNPLLKKEVKWSQYKKVPICVINGVQLNDSVSIVTILKTLLNDLQKLPKDVNERELAGRKYIDERFIRILAPNIYRTYGEAREAFDYITTKGNFSFFEKQAIFYGGAFAMNLVSKKLKKKYNIEDERKELYACADEWMGKLDGKPFHGGEEPDLADIDAYGMMTSIEGLTAFNEMCEATEFGPYFHRMKDTVGEPVGTQVLHEDNKYSL